ncbi:helix-turn-helix domain-containing protein [Hymenobacter sp. BT507]|uniref:Helix-turn-helix domain-containing protein n=1 Tax=Hymenobacter citatus TaxID=2763506 RepID=A0ABR7MM85_9BACT|nr:helix-turn-helix domain-containing protein [Hymenobacter citatus]MBC6612185.1 helix-turn-helix domain-containing protein [Hymenobacter citatus]
MKLSTTLPVLGLASFPGIPLQRPYYVERLQTHVANFPHIATAHAHDFYLLLYVTDGYGTHTIDLVTYELRPGSLFFMAPGQVHRWHLSPEAQGIVVFFDADFYSFRYPEKQLFDYPFFTPAQVPVLYLPFGEAELYPLFARLLTENTGPYPNQADVVRSYLHLLLELATRHYARPSAAPPALTHSEAQIRKFGRLLNQHFRTHRTVHAYAQLLHLTANHLNAICRQRLNKTASSLIHERVVMEAQRLLTHSAQSVAQVATALGFEDASYFSRYFRKYSGQTPEVFRRGR